MIILVIDNKNLFFTSLSLDADNINCAAVIKINKSNKADRLSELNLAIEFEMRISLLVIELQYALI